MDMTESFCSDKELNKYIHIVDKMYEDEKRLLEIQATGTIAAQPTTTQPATVQSATAANTAVAAQQLAKPATTPQQPAANSQQIDTSLNVIKGKMTALDPQLQGAIKQLAAALGKPIP